MNPNHATRFITLLSAFSIASLLGGCNLFSRFDHPTSDPQLISAARAALDQGDLATAQELYQRVSDNEKDIRNSEAAFLTLAQEGASMAAFIEFVGHLGDGGSSGLGLTKFAERLHLTGVGEAKRLAIYTAYQKNAEIVNPSLRAFVKFTTALALTAEILAEAASSNGTLYKTDLVADPTCAPALPDAKCDAPAGSHLSSTTTGADITTTAPTGTDPNLDQLYYAINATYNALQELSASGTFSGASSDFLTTINAIGGQPSSSTPFSRLFRAQLIADAGLNLGE